jgi:uncharacterized protein YrrD
MNADRIIAIRLFEGMPIESVDGVVGEIADVVIDVVRQRVTHLIVQPGHLPDVAHLVPIDAVTSADGHVSLSWSTDQVQSAPTDDWIPPGTLVIRRAAEVVSSDNHVVGRVDGFVIDPADSITHIVLERRHLWGHREITIPMREVHSVVSDRVNLRCTRDEVDGFPSAAFHRPS